MQLVTTFIDFAKTRHEHADFLALLVRTLRKHPRDVAHGGFREVWREVLRNVEDARLAHSDYVMVKRGGKIGIFTPKSKHLRGFQTQNHWFS